MAGIIETLKQLFIGGSGGTGGRRDPNAIYLYFQCDKCGAVVPVRVDKRHDLNREEGPGTFLLKKEVMDNKCFQLMQATVWLDNGYNVVSADVIGGKLISEEEYSAIMQTE
ncbi:MAG: hypothetical protein U9R48_01680 [Chloroflexota bacterium]|nr:hypothetical protein [Chloroflexota bacterium]